MANSVGTFPACVPASSETGDEIVAALMHLTLGRGSPGALLDDDPSGSAALAEGGSTSQEDISGWAADAQEEGKGKMKGKEKGKEKRNGKGKQMNGKAKGGGSARGRTPG